MSPRFFGGIPIELAEGPLRLALAGFGPLASVRVIRDAAHRSRGCAMVRFVSWADAERAVMALDGVSQEQLLELCASAPARAAAASSAGAAADATPGADPVPVSEGLASTPTPLVDPAKPVDAPDLARVTPDASVTATGESAWRPRPDRSARSASPAPAAEAVAIEQAPRDLDGLAGRAADDVDGSVGPAADDIDGLAEPTRGKPAVEASAAAEAVRGVAGAPEQGPEPADASPSPLGGATPTPAASPAGAADGALAVPPREAAAESAATRHPPNQDPLAGDLPAALSLIASGDLGAAVSGAGSTVEAAAGSQTEDVTLPWPRRRSSRPILVRFADPGRDPVTRRPEPGIAPKTVFIGQVPAEVDSKAISDLVERTAGERPLRLIVLPARDGRPACAIAHMATWGGAERAISLLGGAEGALPGSTRPLVARFADVARPASEPVDGAAGAPAHLHRAPSSHAPPRAHPRHRSLPLLGTGCTPPPAPPSTGRGPRLSGAAEARALAPSGAAAGPTPPAQGAVAGHAPVAPGVVAGPTPPTRGEAASLAPPTQGEAASLAPPTQDAAARLSPPTQGTAAGRVIRRPERPAGPAQHHSAHQAAAAAMASVPPAPRMVMASPPAATPHVAPAAGEIPAGRRAGARPPPRGARRAAGATAPAPLLAERAPRGQADVWAPAPSRKLYADRPAQRARETTGALPATLSPTGLAGVASALALPPLPSGPYGGRSLSPTSPYPAHASAQAPKPAPRSQAGGEASGIPPTAGAVHQPLWGAFPVPEAVGVGGPLGGGFPQQPSPMAGVFSLASARQGGGGLQGSFQSGIGFAQGFQPAVSSAALGGGGGGGTGGGGLGGDVLSGPRAGGGFGQPLPHRQIHATATASQGSGVVTAHQPGFQHAFAPYSPHPGAGGLFAPAPFVAPGPPGALAPTGGSVRVSRQAPTHGRKLFVGQLPSDVTESHIWPLFAPFGTVLELSILRASGRSRGCAFVTLSTEAEAEAARLALHDAPLSSGKRFVVRYADARTGAAGKGSRAAAASREASASSGLLGNRL